MCRFTLQLGFQPATAKNAACEKCRFYAGFLVTKNVANVIMRYYGVLIRWRLTHFSARSTSRLAPGPLGQLHGVVANNLDALLSERPHNSVDSPGMAANGLAAKTLHATDR